MPPLRNSEIIADQSRSGGRLHRGVQVDRGCQLLGELEADLSGLCSRGEGGGQEVAVLGVQLAEAEDRRGRVPRGAQRRGHRAVAGQLGCPPRAAPGPVRQPGQALGVEPADPAPHRGRVALQQPRDLRR
jgi:hypothetical protein